MENNLFDLNGIFVGHVIKINNLETKELEIYIPKLTPTLPKYYQEINIPIESYNVIKKNTISVKPFGPDYKVPKPNSLIAVIFFEGDLNKPMWFNFDPNKTNEYIDEINEKELFLNKMFSSIYINDKGEIIPIDVNSKLGTSTYPFKEINALNIDNKFIEIEKKIENLPISAFSSPSIELGVITSDLNMNEFAILNFRSTEPGDPARKEDTDTLPELKLLIKKTDDAIVNAGDISRSRRFRSLKEDDPSEIYFDVINAYSIWMTLSNGSLDENTQVWLYVQKKGAGSSTSIAKKSYRHPLQYPFEDASNIEYKISPNWTGATSEGCSNYEIQTAFESMSVINFEEGKEDNRYRQAVKILPADKAIALCINNGNRYLGARGPNTYILPHLKIGYRVVKKKLDGSLILGNLHKVDLIIKKQENDLRLNISHK